VRVGAAELGTADCSVMTASRRRRFEDCNEATVVTRRPADYAGVAWYALDPRERGTAAGNRARPAAGVIGLLDSDPVRRAL